MKAIRGKYNPDNLYNHMNEVLGKYWDKKRALGLQLSDYYP